MRDKTPEEMRREEMIAEIKELRELYKAHLAQSMALWLKLAEITDALARANE